MINSNISQNTICYGCLACVDACPKGCIALTVGEDGALYPKIKSNDCLQCGICSDICPVHFDDFIDYSKVEIIIGKSKDSDIILNSSSGGLFSEICKHAVSNKYKIYGSTMNADLKVVHECAETYEECYKFRKSKYIQSNATGCYKEIIERLKNGEKVLFSGTPCQCAALIRVCDRTRVSTRNLITINVLCHGAPGQALFDRYREEKELAENDLMTDYVFRSKTVYNGKINSRSALITYSSGKTEYVDLNTDPFLKGYYLRLFIRDGCTKCHFAKKDRTADITLADAWQVEKIKQDWDSHKGVSLIFLNTEKGKAIFDAIKYNLEFQESNIEWAESVQDVLTEPVHLHQGKEKFYSELKKNGFEKSVAIATHRSLYSRCVSRMKRMIRIKQ